MSIFAHRRSQFSMKRFYNWFSPYYKNIEKPLFNIIKTGLSTHINKFMKLEDKTALEYGCGTGALTSQISPLFKKIRAKDLSVGMVEQAKKRTKKCCKNIEFLEGDLLNITEKKNSYDYVFISFALHLFPPEKQEVILRHLVNVAREKVIVVDHVRKWNPLSAFVEWMEGSYYDQFVTTDFEKMSIRLGAQYYFEDRQKSCSVLVFIP